MALVAIILVLGGLTLPVLSVFHDYTELDRHSGSLRGYRTWPFGLKSNSWSELSPLAVALNRHFPGEWQSRWAFHGRTGRGIFGQPTYVSCSTGKVAYYIHLYRDIMAPYYDNAEPQDIWLIYQLLVQEREEEVRSMINNIIQLALEPGSPRYKTD